MGSDAAVFLDRDGVIIEDSHFITSADQVRMIANSAKAIALLNNKFKTFVISNQPAVGRGMCTEQEAKDVNDAVIALLSKEGARIDRTYMCFHHPIHGIGAYKAECECRKPKPGMILQAAREFGIDLSKSFTIGDKTGDIKAGKLAGTKTILVQTGYGGEDGFKDAVPDFVAKDLYGAAKIIMEDKK